MTSDPYQVLVRYYDAETIGTLDDLPAYEQLVKRFGGPVLDVGCGTGRVGFALAHQGVRVVGVDTSEPMLTRARERARREQAASPRMEFHQADITTLSLEERFGLAIFAYNGF